ncbi:MAG TPA: hypothetical protein VJK03_04460 [Candidatus Nanoarchaeia archaeon]|nr:hypothetical protein [Candidatus Nanoarchaeia archaeon]
MKQELKAIHERNRRVELDKAWEVSATRRAVIAVITYIIVVIFLMLIGAPQPWITALVPVIGFILSTLTIPLIKRLWIKKQAQ